MDIPYVNKYHFHEVTDSTSWDRMGLLHLSAGDLYRMDDLGASTIVQVFAKMVDVVVQGPLKRSGASQARPLAYRQGDLSIMQHNRPGIVNVAATAAAFGGLGTIITSSVSSWMSNYISSGSRTLANSALSGTMKAFRESQKDSQDVGHKEDPNERKSVRQQVFGNTSVVTQTSNGYQNLGDRMNTVTYPDSLTGGFSGESDLYGLCRRWFVQRRINIPFAPPTTLAHVAVLKPRPFMAQGTNINPPVTAIQAEYNTGFTAFFQRYFRYWRGSFEYKFLVYAPPTITAKFVVMIDWDGGEITPAFDRTDVGSKQVAYFTVRGTTEFNLSVPFLRKTAWATCGSDVLNGPEPVITFRLVSSSPELSTNHYIPVVIMKRAGSDFRFRSLTTGGAMTEEGLQLSATKQLAVKQGYVNNTQMPDVDEEVVMWGETEPAFEHQAFLGSVPDMMNRHSSRLPEEWAARPGWWLSQSQYTSTASIFASSFAERDIFDQLACLYALQSGSFRVKAGFDRSGQDSLILASMLQETYDPNFDPDLSTWVTKMGDGMQAVVPGIWPVVEVEVPFYSPINLYSHERHHTPDVDWRKPLVDDPLPLWVDDLKAGQTPIPEPGQCFITPGDDFAFHVLRPPPNPAHLPEFRVFPGRVL